MAYLQNIDPLLNLQLDGVYENRTSYCFHIMGRRDNFTSTTVFNDVGMGIGIAAQANFPTMVGTETVQVVSDSANDTVAGSGGRKIKLTYIDVNYDLAQTADINLNGVTPVTVCTDCRQWLWFEVTELGSGGGTAGNLTLQHTSPTTTMSYIPKGSNKSLDAIFLVPDGYTAYVSWWGVRAIKNSQDFRLRATTDSYTRTTGTVFHFQDRSMMSADEHNGHPLPYLKYDARAYIKISEIASSTAAGTRGDVGFTIYLIAD